MISVAADTDAASAGLLPRCKAIPHTDQATAANAPFLNFYLLAICLFTSLSLALSHLFSSFMGNPARCRDNFTGLPGDIRLTTTHTRQSRPQRGSTSHVPFDTSFPERHDDPLAQHFRPSKHRWKACASAVM